MLPEHDAPHEVDRSFLWKPMWVAHGTPFTNRGYHPRRCNPGRAGELLLSHYQKLQAVSEFFKIFPGLGNSYVRASQVRQNAAKMAQLFMSDKVCLLVTFTKLVVLTASTASRYDSPVYITLLVGMVSLSDPYHLTYPLLSTCTRIVKCRNHLSLLPTLLYMPPTPKRKVSSRQCRGYTTTMR